MAEQSDLRFIDADGHVVEHPTEMPAYAPAAYRDRIWHVAADSKGTEWMIMDDLRVPTHRTMILKGAADR